MDVCRHVSVGSIPSFAIPFCIPFYRCSFYFSLLYSSLFLPCILPYVLRHVLSKKQRLVGPVEPLVLRSSPPLATQAFARLLCLSDLVRLRHTPSHPRSIRTVEDFAHSPLTVVSGPLPISQPSSLPLLRSSAHCASSRTVPSSPCRPTHLPLHRRRLCSHRA